MKARKILKIVGAILAVLVVLALVAPLFISSDTLKAQLIAQVKKTTGRTLDIKGKTSVHFLPNIAVSAEDVTLSNPEGFTTPYFVSLKKLATGAQLMPLLHGELIVNGITLEGATINLEQLASGAKNWEFTADKVKDSAAVASAAPQAQKNSSSAIKRFAMGDIDIKDGAINYLQPGAQVVALSAINLTLKGADASSPLKLDGSARYRDQDIKLTVDLAKTRDFLANSFSPLTASLKLPDTSVDFKGEAKMGDSVAARGTLNANAAALPKLLAWASGKQAAAGTPQKVSASGKVDSSGSTLTLSDATVQADDAKGTGVLSVDTGGAVPKVKGNLSLDSLNLDSFTQGGASSGKAAASSSGGGSAPAGTWSSKPVDLSGLRAVDADLDLAWEKLTSGKFTLGATRAHVALAGGDLALNIKQAQLYGGTVSGTVKASPAGIGADIATSGIDIAALSNALAGQSRISGKGNLTLNVNATGNSEAAWVSSLNGNGALKVADGAIKGINIGQFLRDVKTSGLLFRSASESTDFSELTATFTIVKGVLSNSDLAMKSPALRVAGSGSANIPSRTLNYKLMPTITGSGQGQGATGQASGLTIPLIITGLWSNPSVTPDLAGMVQGALTDPKALKQGLKDIKGTLKNFNSGTDLKKALLGSPTPTPATGAAPAKKQKGLGGLLQSLGK